MSWHHGNCKRCHGRSEDELCPRCEALADEYERQQEEGL